MLKLAKLFGQFIPAGMTHSAQFPESVVGDGEGVLVEVTVVDVTTVVDCVVLTPVPVPVV